MDAFSSVNTTVVEELDLNTDNNGLTNVLDKMINLDSDEVDNISDESDNEDEDEGKHGNISNGDGDKN